MASMMGGVQGAVADEVNNRLNKATNELVAKYAAGKGGYDNSVEGPTGAAYKQKHMEEQKVKKLAKEAAKKDNDNNEDDSNQAHNDESLNEDEEIDKDEDREIRNIREQRLREIKNNHKTKLENIGKGHGQYREIVQDEFLSEVTASTTVVCHFYHSDFPRCKIFDHHIQRLVERHIETKFIKIDAEKAPFFIQKVM